MTKRPRSLLFVNQFYWPDVAATGQHLTDLAEFLARRGERVTVFTTLAPYAGRQAQSPPREQRNGVTIRRFRSTSFGRVTHVGRIMDYLSFYVQVLFAILTGPPYDGVVYLTTPPLIFVIGRLARAVRIQRYAIWSMDLHPEAEIASGMIRERSALGRLLRWLYRNAYDHANFVIALGPFMRDRIIGVGVAADRVTVVPPWSSIDVRQPDATTNSALRRRLGIENRFVVMYSGNAGIVHSFDAFCEAMRILKDDERFFFLFVGDGPRRGEIEAFARDERLRHFAYLPYLERGEARDSLGAADAHLISLRPEFAGISIPSKLYGIMAAARPALFVGPTACESAQTVIAANCGVVVDSTDGGAGAAVANVLRDWLVRPDERRRLGANARKAVVGEHEPSVNCTRIAHLIDANWHSRYRQRAGIR